MSHKCALITGVTGQDGAYLSKFLLGRGYSVFGMRPRRSTDTLWRLECLSVLDQVTVLDGDVSDISSLIRIIQNHHFDEVYNLAAQSFVATSWHQPLLTFQITALGAANVLEAIRLTGSKAKFYQASSSEMFGRNQSEKQDEKAPFYPRSPYAIAKLHAHWSTVNYRESFGMFACSGILFNHESPLRGLEFVTRKITDAAARIRLGLQENLRLGNLEARRDWGYAGDYVKAMWLMLQQAEPSDYVIATGRNASVGEFCELAFRRLGLDYRDYVIVDPSLFRPAEVDCLLGDSSSARSQLGWEHKMSLEELVTTMVDADLERVRLSVPFCLTKNAALAT